MSACSTGAVFGSAAGLFILVAIELKGRKVARLGLVVIQPDVHGSHVAVAHISLVNTFMNEMLVPH